MKEIQYASLDYLFKSNAQIAVIYKYLKTHVATASMVAKETGIPQKNICRYKRSLEQSGLLCQTKKAYCHETGFMAWYLTTDNKLFKQNQQLQLFY